MGDPLPVPVRHRHYGVRVETPEGRAVIGWALVPSVFDDDAEDPEYKLVLPEGR